MANLSDHFAQPCCEMKDFVAIVYCPESGKFAKIEREHLVDYEMRVGMSLVNDALLVIEDFLNVLELVNADRDLWVHVLYTENEGNFLRRDFRVLSVNKFSDNNKAYLRFELVDSLSYVFSKTQNAKFCLSTSMALTEFYNEYFLGDSEWKDPGIQSAMPFRNVYLLDIKGEGSKEVQIPGNVNFLTAISKQAALDGCVVFQENNTLKFCTYKSLNSLRTSKIPKYKRSSGVASNSPFNLYFGKFNNASTADNTIATDVVNYDYETKTLNIQEKSAKSSGVTKEKQDTYGYGLTFSETDNKERLEGNQFLDFLNNYAGYVVVPARKEYIRMFNKINVEYYNPSAGKNGDIKNSGDYLITGYTTKVMNRTRLVTLVRIARFDGK